MYLRLKLQNMNELRRQDAKKIEKLEKMVDVLLAKMKINKQEVFGEEEDMWVIYRSCLVLINLP